MLRSSAVRGRTGVLTLPDDGDDRGEVANPRPPSATDLQFGQEPPAQPSAFRFAHEIDAYSHPHHHRRRVHGGTTAYTVALVIGFILFFLIGAGLIWVVVDLNAVRAQCQSHTVPLVAQSFDQGPSTASDMLPVRVPRRHGRNATYDRGHWDFMTAPILQQYVRYPPEGAGVPGMQIRELVDYTVCCHTASGHFTCCNGVGFAEGYGLDCDLYQDPESQEQYVTLLVESKELAERPCTLSYTRVRRVQ